jgi:hypothetical protein
VLLKDISTTDLTSTSGTLVWKLPKTGTQDEFVLEISATSGTPSIVSLIKSVAGKDQTSAMTKLDPGKKITVSITAKYNGLLSIKTTLTFYSREYGNCERDTIYDRQYTRDIS